VFDERIRIRHGIWSFVLVVLPAVAFVVLALLAVLAFTVRRSRAGKSDDTDTCCSSESKNTATRIRVYRLLSLNLRACGPPTRQFWDSRINRENRSNRCPVEVTRYGELFRHQTRVPDT
jgi:hypothetical protein